MFSIRAKPPDPLKSDDCCDITSPVSESPRNLDLAESIFHSLHPQSHPDTDSVRVILTDTLHSSKSQVVGVIQRAEDVHMRESSSSCEASDSDSEFYQPTADKRITNFTKPIQAIASLTKSHKPSALTKNAADSSSYADILPETRRSVPSKMFSPELAQLITPEPSLFAPEYSQEISSPTSQDSSNGFFNYDKLQRPSPPRTANLRLEGSTLTPYMNSIVDEAVHTYYASDELRAISILPGAAPNVSNSSYATNKALTLPRFYQTPLHFALKN